MNTPDSSNDPNIEPGREFLPINHQATHKKSFITGTHQRMHNRRKQWVASVPEWGGLFLLSTGHALFDRNNSCTSLTSATKGHDHFMMLLGQVCSNGITLQQALKALQQLKGRGERGAIIKRLQQVICVAAHRTHSAAGQHISADVGTHMQTCRVTLPAQQLPVCAWLGARMRTAASNGM